MKMWKWLRRWWASWRFNPESLTQEQWDREELMGRNHDWEAR